MKLCRFAKFLGYKANRKEFNTITCSVEWAQVPLSKNSTRGHLSEGVYILSCYAYQIVSFHQVSCFYHNLHDFQLIDLTNISIEESGDDLLFQYKCIYPLLLLSYLSYKW